MCDTLPNWSIIGGGVSFTIDFDLRKSITLTEPRQRRLTSAYKLRPTLRTRDRTGNFSGEVDETQITGAGINTSVIPAGDPTGCSVYVFDGFDTVPDDMYFPVNGSVGGHTNPVAIADVIKVDTGGGTFGYLYTAAFLVAGSYTAALTCDSANDDPYTDQANIMGGDPSNEVIFPDQQNVTVELGTTTENEFPTTP
jgi:hypothetical protein